MNLRAKTIWYLFFLCMTSLFATGQGLQINIAQPTGDTTICPGDSLPLRAVTPFLLTDFDNGAMGVGWSSTQANPTFNNPCGPGPKGLHLWVGTTPSSSRTLETNAYDLTLGGACFVEFWMRYGRVASNGPCEDPDGFAEGVHLQYSTNNGVTWTDLSNTGTEPVGNLSATPPFTTQIPGSGGYWAPHSSSFAQQNSELYYWNKYRCAIPNSAISTNTKFRWAQLSNSSSGWDAWGIDEVFIGCEPANILWSTGDTTNTDTTTLFNSGYIWVQATDAQNNIVRDSIYITTSGPIFNFSQDTIYVPCQLDSVALDAGAGWNAYSWSTSETTSLIYAKSAANYAVNVQDSTGCWASDTLVVVFNRPLGLRVDSACQSFISPSGRYIWDSSGTYFDTLVTANGCDSIVEVSLTIYPTYVQSYQDTFCAGQYFVLPGGDTAFTAGSYSDTLATIKSCDSIINVNLSIIPLPIDTHYQQICNGSYWLRPNGDTASQAGIYIDTIQNTQGCDTINVLSIAVNPIFQDTQTVAICANESFLRPSGAPISNAGWYIDSLQTVSGCDSIIYTNLQVSSLLIDSVTINRCAGEFYVRSGGDTAFVSGRYFDTLTNNFGCDSLIVLNLTVHPVYQDTQNIRICMNESFRLPSGNFVNTPGRYKDTLVSVNGCDSIVETVLQLMPLPIDTHSVRKCFNEGYLLPSNRMVFDSGIYIDTLNNGLTCDSIRITVLNNYPPNTAFARVVSHMCDDSLTLQIETPYDINYFDYEWSNGDKTPVIVNPRQQIVWLTVIDSNNCKIVDSVDVSNFRFIRVERSFPDTVYLRDQPTYISVKINQPLRHQKWTVNGVTEVSAPAFNHTFKDTGWQNIHLLALTQDSCIIDTNFRLYVTHPYDLLMPNAFTPNGDGLNDQFGPIFRVGEKKSYTLQVFSRWGELIFMGKNQPWSGTVKGKPAVQGIYTFRIITTDGYGVEREKFGRISLIR